MMSVPSLPPSAACLLRPRVASAYVLLGGVGLCVTLSAGVAGCAQPLDRPAYRGFDDSAPSDEVANPPLDGPVSPGGTELPPQSDATSDGEPMVILASDLGGESTDAPIVLDPPTTSDASTTDSSGYRTVGGVLGEVNGRPIFTDAVIAAHRNQLRGLAKELDQTTFERAAIGIIADELRARMRELMELSLYERHTRPEEQVLARNITSLWRMRFITDHGGSEAAARQAAYDEYRISLEELGEDQYRQNLQRLFLQKRVFPKVRPSAAELRTAYTEGLARGAFTTDAEIEFSLIEIRPESAADPTSVAEAQARAESIHARARAGEDFADLASKHNDDPGYASRAGRLSDFILPLRPGAFAVPEVEQAAWETEVNGIAPLVRTADGKPILFYIVKVERKQNQTVHSFEDVQDQLVAALAKAKQDTLIQSFLEIEQQRVETPSVDQQNQMLGMAMEIVTQNYNAWRAE